MQIVPAPAAFQLPDDWVLEVRPRGNASKKADKYYYEPHTGRQFRSLSSIKRYLDGEEEPTRRRSKAPGIHQQGGLKFAAYRRIVHNGKLWKLEELEAAGPRPRRRKSAGPATVQDRALSLLPDGWIVEEVPRRCGFKTDTYFIEPMTRRKFRSVPEVQRYLTADDDEYAAKYKPLKMFTAQPPLPLPPPPPRGGCPRKATIDLEWAVKPENFDLFNPPDQITWILSTGTGSASASASAQENWIPFLEKSLIPDLVKQVWQDTFFLGMTGSMMHQIPSIHPLTTNSISSPF